MKSPQTRTSSDPGIAPTGMISFRIWLVQALTLSRLVATLAFALVARENVPLWLVSGLYGYAVATDLVDGYVSRKLRLTSDFGKVADLVADKSLTIVSVLYAAARGVDFFPLAVIAARDVFMMGMRLIVVDGAQLLPTNRIFGGLMAALIWGNTFLLINAQTHAALRWLSITYWIAAFIFMVNVVLRLNVSRTRIISAFYDRR